MPLIGRHLGAVGDGKESFSSAADAVAGPLCRGPMARWLGRRVQPRLPHFGQALMPWVCFTFSAIWIW
jgi:hypothetical protein